MTPLHTLAGVNRPASLVELPPVPSGIGGPFTGTAAANAARRQPVAAHGWAWPSQTAAARALGVSNTFLHYTLQHGTFAKLVMRKLGVKG